MNPLGNICPVDRRKARQRNQHACDASKHAIHNLIAPPYFQFRKSEGEILQAHSSKLRDNEVKQACRRARKPVRPGQRQTREAPT